MLNENVHKISIEELSLIYAATHFNKYSKANNILYISALTIKLLELFAVQFVVNLKTTIYQKSNALKLIYIYIFF